MGVVVFRPIHHDKHNMIFQKQKIKCIFKIVGRNINLYESHGSMLSNTEDIIFRKIKHMIYCCFLVKLGFILQ